MRPADDDDDESEGDDDDDDDERSDDGSEKVAPRQMSSLAPKPAAGSSLGPQPEQDEFKMGCVPIR